MLELDDIPLSTRGRTHEPMAEHRLACPSALGTLVHLRRLFNRSSIDVIHWARLSGDLFYHTVRMSCIVVNGWLICPC